MNIQFAVPSNLKIKNDSVDYTRDDLARAVSYWSHVIASIPENNQKHFAVCLASLSFNNLAFMLALIDSGRSYEKVNVSSHLKMFFDDYNVVFLTGDTQNWTDWNTGFPMQKNKVFVTDSYSNAHLIGNWQQRHSLTINFQSQQQIIEYTSGSTGQPKKTMIDAYIQALSIKTAIDTYFDPNDHCVFLHSMAHTGVHTTAIFPGVFSVDTLCLSDPIRWSDDVKHATHVQFFTPMREYYSLPAKLRTLVFGGDMLKPLLTNYIFERCQVENFYDVYGLTECYPPVAVRKIHSEQDLDKPFEWVNVHHRPCIIDGTLHIERSDNILIGTGDAASINQQGQLFMQGRTTSTVRVNGLLHSEQEFKLHFEKHTSITDHVLIFEDHAPVLIVLEKDQLMVEQYAQTFELEAELRFQSNLRTSGGIKNIK
jgi:acyl-CoA synthetase (AMP-forming)/AMP-acid ligase II